MDMAVDAAGGDDHAFARDDLGARADRNSDLRLDVRITRLTDPPDAAALDPDVGFDDAPVIDDERIRHHRVGHLCAGALALAHAIANHLAAAELHLLAVHGEVLLHLDPEIGIGEPDLVARSGAEHLGIGLSRELHLSLPITLP